LARLIQRKERVPSGTPALLAARCLREADEPQSARRSFELADKLESADPVKLELAEICLVTGSPRRCLEALDGMAQPDPNGQCFFFRAKALRLLGRLDEALRAANRAAQARPCDPDCQVEKGRILEELERHRGAARQYTKAIRVHERHPEALFRRALLNLRRGLRAAARRGLEQCYSYQSSWTEGYRLARAPENSVRRCPEDLEA